MKNLLKTTVCAAALMFGMSAHAGDFDSDLMAGMKARVLGPAAMSGRVAAIDALASDPNFMVVGAATGGVWISENGGLNWTPTFDNEECASVGAVATNQSNPDIIWVGTGEGNTRNSTSIGCGMFKSLDGGKSWTKVGLPNAERINRIALHPTNPNIAYAAVLGKLWGDSEERGLYKTTDGGKTWSKILYANESTGATDVQMDPSNPNKLFASMWQFRRWPYFFKSGGAGSGMYVSHDGGESWKQLTEEDGMPKGELGRSAFAISRSNPNRVYALVEAKESALVRSDDGGRSWSKVNTDVDINDRPFYYNDLAVDPQNPDRVYRVGSRVKMSLDGGKNFEFVDAIDCCAPANNIHIDNHAWWINPNDPRHMIDGNDGGVGITHDGGETWRFVANLPLAQFYHVAVDDAVPYNVYGGLQDNGSWRGPAEVFENGGIRNAHWQEVGFGDGFDTIPDPTNNRRGLTMSQGGFLVAWDLDTREGRLVRPNGPADGTELRFNWNAGLAQSPFDPNVIYYGSQFVHRSKDRGKSWEIISGDLTTNNPTFQTFKESGGITPDVTAAENFTSIVAINSSPIDANVIWVGTDDGRVHVTRDGGQTWESVEGGLRRGPKGGWVPMIEPSRYDASVAFLTVDDHRRGDSAPYVYRLDNFGKRWTSLVTEDLKGYALSVRQDHVDPNLLFVGTEFGLFVSTNAGKAWTKWTAGVPTVSVMDMAIQQRENDLVLGTHGRSIYIVDDYSGLRGLTAADFKAPLKLLSLTDGQQYNPRQTPSSRFPGSGEFRADNETYGVMITFLASGDDLKHPDPEKEKARSIKARSASKEDDSKEGDDKPEEGAKSGKATIKITDASGKMIRTFKQDLHQGINRIVWNMREDGIHRAPPAQKPKDGTVPAGLEVLPGSYTITIEHAGNSISGTANVLKDPATVFTAEDMRLNYEARKEMEALNMQVQDALTAVMNAQRDIKTVEAILKDNKDAPKELKEQVKTVKKALEEAEKRFRVPAKTRGITFDDDKVGSILGQASFYIGSSYDRPSPAAEAQMALARTAVATAIAETNTLLSGDVAALHSALKAAGVGLLAQQPLSGR